MTWFVMRCLVFGLLWALGVVAAMVWSMENAPTAWGVVKLGAAGMVAFVGGIFTYMRDPEKAWSNTPGVGAVKTLPKVIVLIGLAVALAGCSGFGILNQDKTSEQQAKIMAQQNARGCVYFSGTAAPWANVKTVIVGTWGSDPPDYRECWKGLPTGF